jgi:hypothetical protein
VQRIGSFPATSFRIARTPTLRAVELTDVRGRLKPLAAEKAQPSLAARIVASVFREQQRRKRDEKVSKAPRIRIFGGCTRSGRNFAFPVAQFYDRLPSHLRRSRSRPTMSAIRRHETSPQTSQMRNERTFPRWLTMAGIDLKAVVRSSQHEVGQWPENEPAREGALTEGEVGSGLLRVR